MTSPLVEWSGFIVAVGGVVGLLVGSFLNVVVHRLPRRESLVWPGSHCTACGHPIHPRDNVPVLSWLVLRGKCRTCRAPISVRYPAIELANGALWVFVALRARDWSELAGGALLCSACLALAAIDAEFQILPDRITLPMTAAGLVLSFLSTVRTPVSAFLGAGVGAGSLFLVAFVYERVTGQEGMGLGDVKMLGMVGAFLGPPGVLITVLLSSVVGSVVGLALVAAGRGDRKLRLPFGVFLAMGAVATFFFGEALLAKYRSFLV